jgi:hypothetical protein
MIVGEANVKRGFSMPPIGKLGGYIMIAYVPHSYGLGGFK